MKLIVIAGMMILLAAHAGAETYTWTDENGTFNFTDDLSSVPLKYRKNVGKRGDINVQQDAPARAAEPTARVKAVPAQKLGDSDVKGSAVDGLYNGKKPELWQQQMQPLYGEVKRLEQQLLQIEGLIKKPAGISKTRYDGLQNEFKEAQSKYNEALKSYNELNEAANKAGLPAEFRK
jgi:hypothetical protein